MKMSSQISQGSAHQLPEVISRPGELGRDEAGAGMSFSPQAQHPHLHTLGKKGFKSKFSNILKNISSGFLLSYTF